MSLLIKPVGIETSKDIWLKLLTLLLLIEPVGIET